VMLRSHTCAGLRAADVGKTVSLMGWVHSRRDHGSVIFIDLRDRYGLTQIVFNAEKFPEPHKHAHALGSEDVVAIKGTVSLRPQGSENPNLATGEIEVFAQDLQILNEAKTPPFLIEDEGEITEVLRLKYRYLDLRRPKMQQLLSLRHEATASVRRFLNEHGFLEVETPMLTKSTPEGARDYLVPSRVNPGSFFALPQSPQLFKQILMVAGVDRYYQIARCFRDEDLRFDRQPEFTQIDLEMSFVDREQVMLLAEHMITALFKATRGIELATPFPRLSYQDAMDRYGSDKPDLRFDMPLHDVGDFASHAEFKVFKDALSKGGVVKALIVKGGGGFPRSRIDALGEKAKTFGAQGLAWV
jgi:aspartyl-tRNA synthetase